MDLLYVLFDVAGPFKGLTTSRAAEGSDIVALVPDVSLESPLGHVRP